MEPEGIQESCEPVNFLKGKGLLLWEKIGNHGHTYQRMLSVTSPENLA